MAKKNLKKYWLVLLFVIVFFLRLPSLFEPFTYGDEGIYLTLGQAARRGLVWYRDIHDNKPPMLYLLAALAGNFSTYRLILFVWSFVTIFIFYKLADFIFPKNKSAIITSTAAFAVLTSIHTFEGNVANAENFMLLPIILGLLLILRGLDLNGLKADLRRFLLFFSSGILFSLAALFKVPAAFDLVAALVFILLVADISKKKNYKALITNNILLLLGFFLPILLTFIYYAYQNALNQYLTAAFFQNVPYLSSWAQDKPQVGGLPLPLLFRGFLVSALIVSLFILKKKVSLASRLILIWFAFSWFATLLSSRPYPHYLIQILPPLCFSLGLFFIRPSKSLRKLITPKLIPVFLLATLIITKIAFHFWSYPNLPYYFNFYQYVLKLKSRQQYFFDFDPRADAIYQVANYLRTHTLPDEKIFIWGTNPSIYALSRRLPVGRYTVAYHIIDFNGYKETIEILERQPPRYIIVMASEQRPFPEFKAFVAQNYALEKTFGEAQIFHRII